MTRTVKHPDERRSELIACAQTLFYTKGYENTSVRDIVDGAGVAKGTFYYYFDSKPAILEATIDELIAYSVSLMSAIIDDPALSAVEKWKLGLGAVGNWKAENKEEMIALLHMMRADENALLYHKLKSKTVEAIGTELGKIVKQGVGEGVFDTEFPESAAQLALASAMTLSDAIYDILLHPEQYDDPAAQMLRKIAAVQAAIERILGAEKGLLPLMDARQVALWFDGRTEPQPEKTL